VNSAAAPLGLGNHDDPQTRGSRPGLYAGAPSGGSQSRTLAGAPFGAQANGVYYDVEEAPERKVLIRAVGIKERNRVRVGRKELQL
jgi:hypothetical protein